eukprot:UN32732
MFNMIKRMKFDLREMCNMLWSNTPEQMCDGFNEAYKFIIEQWNNCANFRDCHRHIGIPLACFLNEQQTRLRRLGFKIKCRI